MGQPGVLRRPGAREQFPDDGQPSRQRGVHHLRGGPLALLLPCRRPVQFPRRAGSKDRACAGGGQDPLGPGDGLLGQRGDREPPPGGSGPQLLADLVEPGTAAPQPGQVGLGRGRVDQDRPGCHREEGRRARVVHRGDRVLPQRQIDAFPFLDGGLPGAVERHGVGRRELPAGDLAGLVQEPADLAAPGLPAFLALVRDQIVVAGNAVHGGGKRILVEPAPVYPVG